MPDAIQRRSAQLARPRTQEAVVEATVILQQWQGWVVDIGDDSFTARLVPQVGEGGELIAEIYTEQIPDYCRGLLCPGAYFLWTITDSDSVFSFIPAMKWGGEALLESFSYDMRDAQKYALRMMAMFGGDPCR